MNWLSGVTYASEKNKLIYTALNIWEGFAEKESIDINNAMHNIK